MRWPISVGLAIAFLLLGCELKPLNPLLNEQSEIGTDPVIVETRVDAAGNVELILSRPYTRAELVVARAEGGEPFQPIAVVRRGGSILADTTIEQERASSYLYRVRAVDGDRMTEWSQDKVFTTDGRYLNTPRDVRARLQGYQTVALTWQDRTRKESGYVVERQRVGEERFVSLAHLAANATAYEDTLPQAGVYRYRARAESESGGSRDSEVAEIEASSNVLDITTHRTIAYPVGLHAIRNLSWSASNVAQYAAASDASYVGPELVWMVVAPAGNVTITLIYETGNMDLFGGLSWDPAKMDQASIGYTTRSERIQYNNFPGGVIWVVADAKSGYVMPDQIELDVDVFPSALTLSSPG